MGLVVKDELDGLRRVVKHEQRLSGAMLDSAARKLAKTLKAANPRIDLVEWADAEVNRLWQARIADAKREIREDAAGRARRAQAAQEEWDRNRGLTPLQVRANSSRAAGSQYPSLEEMERRAVESVRKKYPELHPGNWRNASPGGSSSGGTSARRKGKRTVKRKRSRDPKQIAKGALDAIPKARTVHPDAFLVSQLEGLRQELEARCPKGTFGSLPVRDGDVSYGVSEARTVARAVLAAPPRDRERTLARHVQTFLQLGGTK